MKRFVSFLTLITFVLTASAQVISREEARLQAEQFLQQQGHSATLRFTPQLARGKTSQQLEEVPDYYVFNADTEQGFVIMAADSRLSQPVLAYSLHGSFDPDNLIAPVKDWLITIEKQMEWLRENNSPAPAANRAPGLAIPQLLKTTWHQTEPYNSRIKDGAYLTGCGATAMAQVMNYHRFPNSVQAAIPSYTTQKLNVHMDGIAAGSPIDWANMINDYHAVTPTTAQINAVANLMLYCGTSIQMDYSPSNSGSALEDIASALKNYFGYYKGIRMRYHNEMNNQAWEDLIYGELSAGRPVMISGMSAKSGGSGHIFICDGYDGSGLYHINWGWGGYEDGFFQLTNFTLPDEPISYNFWQGCITGVKPDDGTFKEDVVLTTLDFGLYDIDTWAPTTKTEYVRPEGYAQYPVAYGFYYKSNLANAYHFDVNVGVYQNGKLVEVLFGNNVATNIELDNNAVFSFGASMLPRIGGTTFQKPGTYIVKVVSRQTGTTEWIENEGSDQYCLVCVIDNNMKMTCSIGEGTAPGPGPDEPETISEAQRTQLTTNLSGLTTLINQKVSNLNDEKAKLEEVYADAQEGVVDCAALRNRYIALRQQVENSELSNDQKQDFYQSIDSSLEQLGGDNVEKLAQQLVTCCETVLGNIENHLAALSAMSSQVSNLSGQVSSVTDVAAFTKLNNDYEALSASYYSLHNSFSAVNELKNATSALSILQNNVNLFTNDIANMEQYAKQLIELSGLAEQQAAVNEKLVAAKNQLEQLDGELTKSNNAFTDLSEAFSKDVERYTSVADKLNSANETMRNSNLSDSQREELAQQMQGLLEQFRAFETLISSVNNKIKELSSQAFPVDERNALVRTFTSLVDDFNSASSKEALNDVETRLASLAATIEEATNRNNAYNESMATVQSDQQSLQTPITELESAVTTLVETIQKYEQENINAQEQLQALKKATAEKVDLLNQQMLALQEDFTKRFEIIDALDYSMDEKRQKLQKLIAQLQDALHKLADADITDGRRESLIADAQALEISLQKVKEDFDKLVDEIKSKIVVTADRVNELTQACNELDSQLATASTEEDFESISTLCETLAGQILEVKNALADERSNLSDMTEPVAGFMANADELEEAIDKLDKDIDEAVRLTAEEVAQDKELQALKEAVAESLNALKQQIESLQTDFGKRKDDVEAIGKALDEKRLAYQTVNGNNQDLIRQLQGAELSDEQRESLTDTAIKIEVALHNIGEDLEKLDEQLSALTTVTADDVNALTRAYNDLVDKLDDASTKDELKELADQSESLATQIKELANTLATELGNLSELMELVDAFLPNADELDKAIADLSGEITQAEKVHLAKKELEEARSETEKQLNDVKAAADEEAAEIAKIKADAQVVSDVGEVVQLLETLATEEKRLAAVINDLKSQQDALSAATSKEEIEAINNLIGQYMTDLQAIQGSLKKLRAQLEAVLTAINPLIVDGKRVVGCYDTNGRPADIHKKGMKILRLSDGTTRKVYIK